MSLDNFISNNDKRNETKPDKIDKSDNLEEENSQNENQLKVMTKKKKGRKNK